MSKQVILNVDKIYLVQSEEGQPDLIVFMVDAPSPVPSDPNVVPAFFAGAEAGYGGTWLQKAFGVQPDEVISQSEKANIPPELEKTLAAFGM